MRFLIVLALFLSVALSQATIFNNGLAFDTSNNVTVNDNRLTYRQTSLFAVPLIPLTIYSSLAVDAQGSQSSGNVDADILLGMIYMPHLLIPQAPTAWLAYITASATYQSIGQNWNGDISGSAALIGSVYTKIEEVNPQNFVVKTYNFRTFSWSSTGVVESGSGKELKYQTFSSTSNGFTTSFTFAVSSVVGKLNVGGATVTPRNMEGFVEFQNYPYTNPVNKLRLTMYVGQANADASATFTATGTVVAGTGKSQVYMKVAGDAVVDGNVASVSVSGLTELTTDLSDLQNDVFKNQINSLATGNVKVEVRKIQVSFPAGATKISYDPTIGYGLMNSVGFLAPSLSFIFVSICVLFYLF